VVLGDNGVGKTTLLDVLKNTLTSSTTVNSTCCHEKMLNNILLNIPMLLGTHSKIKPRNSKSIHTHGAMTAPVPHKKIAKFKNSPIPVVAKMYATNYKAVHVYAYWANRKPERYDFSFKPTTPEPWPRSEDELIKAEEWLLRTDYIANKSSEIQDIYKNRFETIKDVLIHLLPGVEDIRVSVPTQKLPFPRIQFKTADDWLLFFQLSLGDQTMTTWMVDLAARLFDAYPPQPHRRTSRCISRRNRPAFTPQMATHNHVVLE
jgi:hypothetical protein